MKVTALARSRKLCSTAILLLLWGKPSLAQTHSEAALIAVPPLSSSGNLYSEAAAGKVSPKVVGALARVYVPNHASGSVTVIDPDTFRVVGSFAVGRGPQHVVPSWDLHTLWITNNGHRSRLGSVTPIDPKTGKPGKPLKVLDPYNMYFTPDGTSSIVVDEALRRLDFRDPHTMKLQYSISTPSCHGINHGDFSSDGSFAIFTCEFSHSLIKIDLPERRVTDTITLPARGMPQDIRLAPDGSVFYVADMMADGVHLLNGETMTFDGFIPTGIGAHGLTIARGGRKLYVANRGAHGMHGHPRGPGSITVIDFASRAVEATWPIPGGGSPDMGNVSADGSVLWVSGRFDNVVYGISTDTGMVRTLAVGHEPHGLTIWPQPGRYSLGHTGNMR